MELPFRSSRANVEMTAVPPVNPDFVEAKLGDYYDARLQGQWHGKHPMKGRIPNADAVLLRSNDYLGLAHHPSIIDAEVTALRNTGHGESVSRAWQHHVRDTTFTFEERIAALMQAESALLCSSGYTANVGLIQAIARPGSVVFLDQKAHASMWEGVKSAQAQPIFFRHNDAKHLSRQIATHGPGLVCIESLYSTDGALAPLTEFAAVCAQQASALMVDETHSFGTQGPAGNGLVAAQGLSDSVHFRTFGLSKAVASRGGVIVASRRNIEYLRYRAMPSIFSTSVLPHEVAGYTAALDVLAAEGWRRDKLHRNFSYLHQGLDHLGYNVEASKTQIIALEAGDIGQTLILRDALESRGVFGAIFFPPAAPEKRCLMRLTVNCNLTQAELNRVLSVCDAIRSEVGMGEWRSTRRKTIGAAQQAREAA
jgi:CAI-1 autoinducer synthase